MSAHLAIPATTTVLRQLIVDQLKKPYTGMTAPAVQAAPPPRAPATNGQSAPSEEAGLFLYLHHVAANTAWRNMLDPAIASDGTRLGHPPLVLDLHYLLAATGATLEREVLLGLGMTALHRNPIVARAKIQAVLGAIAVPPDPTGAYQMVGQELLGDPAHQPEQLTIALAPLDVDLSTKLWSALQAPMRPCAHYLVTTVFLTSDAVLPDGPLVEEVNTAVGPVEGSAAPAALPLRAIESPVP